MIALETLFTLLVVIRKAKRKSMIYLKEIINPFGLLSTKCNSLAIILSLFLRFHLGYRCFMFSYQNTHSRQFT